MEKIIERLKILENFQNIFTLRDARWRLALQAVRAKNGYASLQSKKTTNYVFKFFSVTARRRARGSMIDGLKNGDRWEVRTVVTIGQRVDDKKICATKYDMCVYIYNPTASSQLQQDCPIADASLPTFTRPLPSTSAHAHFQAEVVDILNMWRQHPQLGRQPLGQSNRTAKLANPPTLSWWK